ncbi:MAG: outer membrane protein assembly factor BamD [Rubrivivax sp.]|nr:outer membrane protein assembly factor BamD [Rubrivivax sp.]
MPTPVIAAPCHRQAAAALRALAWGCVVWLVTALGALAHAQLLDDLDLRREGADAVLVIRLVAEVQLVRSVGSSAGDQSLIFYRLLASPQGAGPAQAQRLAGRSSLAGSSGIPAVTVTDEAEAGIAGDERRLLVRFGEPVAHRVRAGRGGRQIEVVLLGRGAALAAAAPAAAPPGAGPVPAAPGPAGGSYRVTIDASEGGQGLSTPIPAALQHLNVFTTRRVEQGRTIVETHIGPFATRSEAEFVLSVARLRFPNARVTLPSGAAPAAGADVPTTTFVIPSAPSTDPLRPAVPRPAAPPPAAASAPPAATTAPAAAPAPVPAAAASAPAPAAAASAPAPAAAASAPAPAAAASAAAPAAAASAAGPAAALPEPPSATPMAPAEVEARAAALMAAARAAMSAGQWDAAIEALSTLLDLPPNSLSRAAQALIGEARLKAGDTGRARAEFEAFLRLYPQGPDADRARAALVELGAPAPAATAGVAGAASAPDPRYGTTTTGSVSLYYYGGQSKIRTQEFQDSGLGGLPTLVSDATLSGTDQRQWVGSTDLNWRRRDADTDQRFVFRDTYTRDELRPDKSRNRLSSLYYDHRSISDGWQVRLGRQSPLGGGVLGRFDGAWAGYTFRPRWKASVVAGVPSDDLLDARRRFYGVALDAEALTPNLGASLYAMQQTIDGEIDRRAVGTDWRYADGGLSGTAQIDYDVLLRGLNIASVQGSWQRPDNSVFTFLYDRRKQPLLSLGNTLFFVDPNLATRPTTITELLATSSIEALRERARMITATSTQGALGFTTPVSKSWQVGLDIRLSNTTAVAAVADILPTGLPSTGDIWSLGGQLIGTNLYSARDTHVFIANAVRGPTFHGELISYNNASTLSEQWQLEPSLKVYRQNDDTGLKMTRWTPGLRVTWRVVKQVAVESEVSVESAKTSGPNRSESSSRTFYYLGARFEF